MKLKRIIQVIKYSNLLLTVALMIPLVILVYKAKDGRFFIFELLITLPFLFTFFFRKIIISRYIKRTPYPGVLYAVLEKMQLSKNLDITLTDEMLDEIYKPNYPTSAFLADNGLKIEIGRRKPSRFVGPVIILVCSIVLGLFYKYGSIRKEPFVFVLVTAFMALTIVAMVWKRKEPDYTESLLKFGLNTLELPQQILEWKDIYDWNIAKADGTAAERISINYYDLQHRNREIFTDITQLDIRTIDFLLLMTHFKGKYGG